MQETNADTMEAPVKGKRKFKIQGPLFGTSGIMFPLLTSLHAAAILALVQQVQHPTAETTIAFIAAFGICALMAGGQDLERYLRRRFRRRGSKSA